MSNMELCETAIAYFVPEAASVFPMINTMLMIIMGCFTALVALAIAVDSFKEEMVTED